MALFAQSPRRLLLVTVGLLVLVAGLWAWRQGSRAESSAGTLPGTANSADARGQADRGPRSREKRPRREGSAPSRSASKAVAALVGDSTLSDPEVAVGLQRIVVDAGRPLDERLEALDHALNLIPNDNPALLHEIAGHRILPDELRMRILAEALNRPPRLQGDLLVLLLENAAGDARQEVLRELAGLCGEDLGEDPAAWRGAVDKLPTGF
jgi:hypothetical protein